MTGKKGRSGTKSTSTKPKSGTPADKRLKRNRGK